MNIGEKSGEVSCVVTLDGKAIPLDKVGFIYSPEEGVTIFARLETSEKISRLTENASKVCGSCDSLAANPLCGFICEDPNSLASAFHSIGRADSCDCWKAISGRRK